MLLLYCYVLPPNWSREVIFFFFFFTNGIECKKTEPYQFKKKKKKKILFIFTLALLKSEDSLLICIYVIHAIKSNISLKGINIFDFAIKILSMHQKGN